MARLTQITPFVCVSDVGEAIAFFEGVLGFACTFAADNYAFLRRDGTAVRLIQAAPSVDLDDPAAQNSFYIDVTGLDELYTELKPALDRLPGGHVRAPFDQDYGQREFHVIYQSTLIFFGEAVKEDQ